MTEASRQTWAADDYAANARFVSDLGADILARLNAKRGERILDLGCGDGVLTEKIAGIGCHVVGVDTSGPLLAAASARGLDARLADGHDLTFDGEFDAVFSNAALHWMTQPARVLQGVFRALKPGGRFVAEFGGHGNVAAIVTAMRSAALAFHGDIGLAGPWFYPTADEYGALLTAAGFEVRYLELTPRPTMLPSGIEAWLLTFRKVFFDSFDSAVRAEALAHTVDLLEPSLRDRSGTWTADYVRLKVVAYRFP